MFKFCLYFYIVYAIFVITYLTHFFCKYSPLYIKLGKPDQCELKHKPFQRIGVEKWSKLEIYLGALFILIPRLIICLSSLGLFIHVWLRIVNLGYDRTKRFHYFRRYLLALAIKIVGRIFLFSNGFYSATIIHKKITDFIPDYVPPKNIK